MGTCHRVTGFERSLGHMQRRSRAAYGVAVLCLVLLGHNVQVAKGSLGARFWRIRAITASSGYEWALTHLSFYDSDDAGASALPVPSVTCTGWETPPPEECIIFSTTKEI